MNNNNDYDHLSPNVTKRSKRRRDKDDFYTDDYPVFNSDDLRPELYDTPGVTHSNKIQRRLSFDDCLITENTNLLPTTTLPTAFSRRESKGANTRMTQTKKSRRKLRRHLSLGDSPASGDSTLLPTTILSSPHSRRVNNGPNIRYPTYYISPYGNAEPINTFFINYLLHQALSLTILITGYCFFLAIGAQLITSLFSSIVALLLTAMLAGLLAFPVAALGSALLTTYLQKPQSQQYLFLNLALASQIVFNVLLLAGLSSTYFFALCALYSVVPLIGLAVLSSLPYCHCPVRLQTDSQLSSNSMRTPSPIRRSEPLVADPTPTAPSLTDANDWIDNRHTEAIDPDSFDYLAFFGTTGLTPPEKHLPQAARARDSQSRESTVYSYYLASLGSNDS